MQVVAAVGHGAVAQQALGDRVVEVPGVRLAVTTLAALVWLTPVAAEEDHRV
jgi:hypothetical protein